MVIQISLKTEIVHSFTVFASRFWQQSKIVNALFGVVSVVFVFLSVEFILGVEFSYEPLP